MIPHPATKRKDQLVIVCAPALRACACADPAGRQHRRAAPTP